MDSLNQIIRERKKERGRHNQNFKNIVESTPQSMRIQSSLGNDETVFIQNMDDMRVESFNESREMPSLTPNDMLPEISRGLEEQKVVEGSRRNNGILKMSPKSQSKFF